MRFYTDEECKRWLGNRPKPDASGLERHCIAYPKTPSRALYVSQWIASNVMYRMPALLWVTEPDVWKSNWHLYYRLRQSYHDFRLMDEAPGHLFLEHESEDLATFVQLTILNGWDAYLLTRADYINLWFSNDEFIDAYSKEQSLIDIFRKNVEEKTS